MRNHQRDGVVLFVVTVVITLASLAAYGFLATMQGESKASLVAGDQFQVAHVAASGEEFVAVWLQAPRAERATIAALYGETVFAQPVTEPTISNESISAGQFHIVVPSNQGSFDSSPGSAFSGAAFSGSAPLTNNVTGFENSIGNGSDTTSPFRYGVADESAKIHLRTLLAWDAIWPGSARNSLLQLPGMSSTTADAILDWIDKDNEPREFGAESEYYNGLTPPSAARNAIPNSIGDLLAVRGVSRALLLGGNTNVAERNANLNDPNYSSNSATSNSAAIQGGASPFSPNSQQPAASSIGGAPLAGGHRPWSDFLTVYSAERNVTYNGSPRINLNNPELDELHSELLAQFPEDLADFVIYHRQFGSANSGGGKNSDSANTENDDDPFEQSNVDIANIDAETITSGEATVDLTLPAEFEFTSVGELIDAVVLLPPKESDDDDEEDPKPRLLASPLSVASGPNPEFSSWLDKLTVRSSPVLIGRVNILAADPIVISALPLRDSSIATQIIATRSTLNQDTTIVPGTSWLLTENLIDRANFVKLARFLTTGGEVARFQVVATHPHSPLVNRFEVILDGTVKNTQRVYFRDLRRAGRPGMFDMFQQPPTNPASTGQPAGLTLAP